MLLLLFLFWATVPESHDLEAVCLWGEVGEETGWAGLKERFSLQTLPEAAQSVKGPEEQLGSSQRSPSALPGLRDQMQQEFRW